MNKFVLEYYEQGGDRIIESWEKHEKQAFLNKHGVNAKQEALALFDLWHEHTEGIRKTAF